MNNIVKTTLFTTAFALVSAPVAIAEPTAFEVTIEYDKSLLATEAGSAKVLKSIKKQAKQACLMSRSTTMETIIDRACVKDVVTKSITKIQDVQLEQGLETARSFASLEGSLSSAPEQR